MRYMGFRRNTINLLYLLSGFAARTHARALHFCLFGRHCKMEFLGVCAFANYDCFFRFCSLIRHLYHRLVSVGRRARARSQIKPDWWWYTANANNQSEININSNKLIRCAVEVDGFLCALCETFWRCRFFLHTHLKRSRRRKKNSLS